MQTYAALTELQHLVGTCLGASAWVVVDQERIDLFARATGDHQWIHVDPERAREGPFGSTVAHGFLTLSLLPSLVASAFRVDDVEMSVNYGLNRVRFTSPVPVGARVRASFTLNAYEPFDGGALLTLAAQFEREGVAKPVCIAESLSRRHVRRPTTQNFT